MATKRTATPIETKKTTTALKVKPVTKTKPAVKKAPVVKPATPKLKNEMPTFSTMPTVKRGSKETGPITLLQMNLKNRGYYDGKVDGNFGPKTESSVKEFQKDLGKPISGSVGKKTWEALQDSKLTKIRQEVQPVVQEVPQVNNAPAGTCRVLIEGLTRFQAEMLVKLLSGNTSCRVLT